MDKRQTAIDQLRDRLLKEFGFAYSDNIHDELKAMEKEQIIEANEDCSTNELGELLSGEQYYTSIYGK